MSVMLGFIHANTVTTGFMESVLHATTLDPRIKAVQSERGWAGGLGESRDRLVRKFLASEYEWLWFVDTDIIFKPGALDALLKHEVLMVSANYSIVFETSNFNWYTRECAYKWADPVRMRGMVPFDKYEGLMQVDTCGAGCLLVYRDVFTEIGEDGPWFEEIGQMGEDVSFCHRVGDAGLPIWFDCDVKVLHQKTCWV